MSPKYTQQVQQTQPQQLPSVPTYSDRAFLHSWVAGAGLPLVQAIITSALIMLLAAVLIYAFDGYDYIKPVVVTGALSFVFTWILLQRRWLSLTQLEKWTGLDLNNDHVVGDPKFEPFVVHLNEITPDKHWHQDQYDWTKIITKEQLIKFSDGVINRGKPISRRTWIPIVNGFSRDAYDAWQLIMIKAELIRSQGSGFEMTDRGRKFFTYWASLSPTPLVGDTDDERPLTDEEWQAIQNEIVRHGEQ